MAAIEFEKTGAIAGLKLGSQGVLWLGQSHFAVKS